MNDQRKKLEDDFNLLTQRRNQRMSQFISEITNYFDEKLSLAKFTLTGFATLLLVFLSGIVTYLDKIKALPLSSRWLLFSSFVLVSFAVTRVSFYLAKISLWKFNVLLRAGVEDLDALDKDGKDLLEKLNALLATLRSERPMVAADVDDKKKEKQEF